MENKLLIVIDAQEDFTRGSLRNGEAIKALPVIRSIVDYAYEHFRMKTVYTQDIHNANTYLTTQEGKNLPVLHCIRDRKGCQICHEVMTEKSRVIEKNHFGYMPWGSYIYNDVDEIWMCGFCTDICVMANYQIIHAMYPEIPITVFSDACAGSTPELHEAALRVMRSCHANIQTWEEVKNELCLRKMWPFSEC